MGLANTIIGSGILVDAEKVTRVYFFPYSRPLPGQKFGRAIEITERETRVWVALTKDAAEDAVVRNIQPDDGGQYSYAMAESNRVIKSYVLSRDYSKVQEYQLTDELTATAAPTFNPVAGEQEGPVSVAVSCATPNAIIKYKAGTGYPENYADPDWQSDSVENGDSVSVPPGDWLLQGSKYWIKAKAWAPGYTSSSVATAEYTEPE